MRLQERDVQRLCENKNCDVIFGVANRFDPQRFCTERCRSAERNRKWNIQKRLLKENVI